MYNIYVTNKSPHMVFVRLKPGEISSLNVNIHQELHSLVSDSEMDEDYLQSYLVRWGFCLIPRKKTLSFTIGIGRGHDGTRMYASLYALSKLWMIDYEVDYINYGCLFVKSEHGMFGPAIACYFTHAYLVPVWITARNDEKLPRDIIKAGSNKDDGTFYFGRSHKAIPCIVRSRSKTNCTWYVNKSYHQYGELLQDTGHQLLRALSGDPVPPNAVIVGVSEPEGSLYLGRIGGNMPCTISTEDGKIKYFNDLKDETKRVESGEIMVLTNDTTD